MTVTSVNANQVFHNAPQSNDYLKTITLDPKLEDKLRASRDKIRDALRSGLNSYTGFVPILSLFENSLSANAPTSFKPRFRMQGSFVYRTINMPEHLPPQQVDLDDGMYIPMSFLESTQLGGKRPIVDSSGLFTLVQNILQPLCDAEGWELDKSKSSCVRVKLSDIAHLDVPIYAIPDEEFSRIHEQVNKAYGADSAKALLEEIDIENSLLYKQLNPNLIWLAHRETGWEHSDPKKVEDWFLQAIERHGEQIRRVSRYLKGWRDFKWKEGKLTSLSIMACVVDFYDKAEGEIPSQDDKALLLITQVLPHYMAKPIDNPVIRGKTLDDKWSADDRKEIINEATNLAASIKNALTQSGTNPKAVLNHLKSAFGNRIPDDESLVKIEQNKEAEILKYEPAKVSEPNVRRTQSG